MINVLIQRNTFNPANNLSIQPMKRALNLHFSWGKNGCMSP